MASEIFLGGKEIRKFWDGDVRIREQGPPVPCEGGGGYLQVVFL